MKTYTIGEVSKIFDISVQAIRLYQKQGLVQPIVNENSGYRYFDDKSLEQLWRLKVLQSAGFELKEIKHFSEIEIEEKVELLKEKKKLLELSIMKQQYTYNFLTRQLHSISQVSKTHTIKIKSYPRRYGIAFTSPRDATSGDFIVTLNSIRGKMGINHEVTYRPSRRTCINEGQVVTVDFLAMLLDQEITEDYVKAGRFITLIVNSVKTNDAYKQIIQYAKENNLILRGDAIEILKVNNSLIAEKSHQLKEIQVAIKE